MKLVDYSRVENYEILQNLERQLVALAIKVNQTFYGEGVSILHSLIVQHLLIINNCQVLNAIQQSIFLQQQISSVSMFTLSLKNFLQEQLELDDEGFENATEEEVFINCWSNIENYFNANSQNSLRSTFEDADNAKQLW